MNLDGSNATSNAELSINVLKSTVDIHLPYITNILNLSIEGHFPNELKLPELRQGELQACQCFTPCVKGLWKNHVSSNRQFHDR